MSFDGPKNLMSFDGPLISCLLMDPTGPSKDMSVNKVDQNNLNSNWKKILGFRNTQEKLKNWINFETPDTVHPCPYRGQKQRHS